MRCAGFSAKIAQRHCAVPKMEDVIFNGTQQRKALAYSEVTLEFDNSDGLLKVPFLQVAITRRVYRSGESAGVLHQPQQLPPQGYLPSLLRHRHWQGWLFHHQSRQGGGDLSNKSGDRRAAFEEAAGVMRYRVRKKKRPNVSSTTPKKTLERIEDILKELGDRLAPLEEQSASARAYLRLRDELKDLEVNLFLYQYDRMSD